MSETTRDAFETDCIRAGVSAALLLREGEGYTLPSLNWFWMIYGKREHRIERFRYVPRVIAGGPWRFHIDFFPAYEAMRIVDGDDTFPIDPVIAGPVAGVGFIPSREMGRPTKAYWVQNLNLIGLWPTPDRDYEVRHEHEA